MFSQQGKTLSIDEAKAEMCKLLNVFRNQNNTTIASDAKKAETLLRVGVKPDDFFEQGVTFFQFVMQAGDVKMIKVFIDAGANVNSISDDKIQKKWVPLEMAAQRGDSEIFKLILDATVDVSQNSKVRNILIEQEMKALGKITERLCTPARAFGLSEGSDGKAYREKNEAEFYKMKERYEAMMSLFNAACGKKFNQIS